MDERRQRDQPRSTHAQPADTDDSTVTPGREEWTSGGGQGRVGGAGNGDICAHVKNKGKINKKL